MAGVDAFLKEILEACEKSEIVRGVNVESFDNVILKVRIYLVEDFFIDVFYNDDTKRVAFALIKNEKRIFGADNTGGWHIHPFEDPERHEPCEPMSFEEFLEAVEERLKS
ncbi:hypothetical protein [Ferroglobus sp.]|uniref:hypothetical protein n=1 Tax=Ferroglobus sp. TaxID=2614230 RepID=UPI0025BE47B9|nr:hypothetical protein [Ferroglobus sp.]